MADGSPMRLDYMPAIELAKAAGYVEELLIDVMWRIQVIESEFISVRAEGAAKNREREENKRKFEVAHG